MRVALKKLEGYRLNSETPLLQAQYRLQNQPVVNIIQYFGDIFHIILVLAEAVTVKPMRNRRAQSKETPVKLFTSPDKQTDNNDQLSQVTCEILDLVQIPNPNKLWLLAGTSVGLALVNLGSKAVESTATFENIRRTEAILSAITSSIKMGNSSPGAKDGVVHVVAQFSTDGKTAAFPIHVSSEKRFDDTVSIVAKDQPKGFFAQIQKVNVLNYFFTCEIFTFISRTTKP